MVLCVRFPSGGWFSGKYGIIKKKQISHIITRTNVKTNAHIVDEINRAQIFLSCVGTQMDPKKTLIWKKIFPITHTNILYNYYQR